MDEKLAWRIRAVSKSRDKEQTNILQAVESHKEPELNLVVVSVDLSACEEGHGEPEGGDEMHQSLPHHTPPKLWREEEIVAGHQHQVDEQKGDKEQRIAPNLVCNLIKALAEIVLEFKIKRRPIQFRSGI